jgi:hypothetical protein
VLGYPLVRRYVASIVVVVGLFGQTPAGAADLGAGAGVGWGAAVHAEPSVTYDYEPGIVVRAYWLTPWAGRHYYPAAGKMPVVGRREVVEPAKVSGKTTFHREWSSFPVDTIEQPPLILNQQQYFPSGGAPSGPGPSK